MSYLKLSNGSIMRIVGSAVIPADSANEDYLEYLAWAAAGNVAEDMQLEPMPPATRITRAQGKRQLIGVGLYDPIKAWVDDPNASEVGRIGFYDEAYWVINDTFVKMAQEQLGLTDDELQTLFNDAATL